MGKKPETPPIDLSAKRVTIPKAPETAAPAALMPAVAIKPADIASTAIRPASINPVGISSAKDGGAKPSEEDVRIGAYLRWDAAGRPEGDGVHFWLQAEQELISGGAAIAQESPQKQ